jgi:hypothetical protein
VIYNTKPRWNVRRGGNGSYNTFGRHKTERQKFNKMQRRDQTHNTKDNNTNAMMCIEVKMHEFGMEYVKNIKGIFSRLFNQKI